MVEHHVHEEEDEIFPAAEDALSDEECRTILQNVQELKKEKPAAWKTAAARGAANYVETSDSS